MMGSAQERALANFCRSNSLSEQGKSIAAVVLPDLQRKGMVRKEASSLTSVFGTFCRHKSN
jgi:hypothetical protein